MVRFALSDAIWGDLMLKRLTAVGAAIGFISALILGSAPLAIAAGDTGCNQWGVCEITPPPTTETPGTGAGEGTTDPVTGITPGPTTCYAEGYPKEKKYEIPCSSEDGSYDASTGCRWKLAATQKAPPAGASEGDGAWYTCSRTVFCDPDSTFACPPVGSRVDRWLTTPPAGVMTLTPAQAAAALVKTFKLEGIAIGSTTKVSGKGAVGLPVWLWVENQTPLSFGPYVESATLGGVTVTATAKVANIAYSMGDGQMVVCANAGTPYVKGYGNTDSPTCGHRYSEMSPGDGAQPYAVTATSNWEVVWTSSGGGGGVIGTTTQSQTQIRVGELQAVNVNP